MIADLDEAIRQLLLDELPLENGQIDIKFDQPTREWSARLTRPAINLYLYDVRENKSLRNHQWQEAPAMSVNMGARRRTPYRVDCTYLLTTWAAEPEDEHRLLSAALLALFRHPILPAERLQGALENQPFDVQTRLADSEKLANPAEIWGALENEVRPTIPYVVTLALDPWTTLTEPLVRTLTLRTGQRSGDGLQAVGESLFIGGTVRDGDGEPQQGIKVAIKDTGYVLTTDDEGRFRFGALLPGTYTLLAWPEKGRPAEKEIELIDQNGDYDIEL